MNVEFVRELDAAGDGQEICLVRRGEEFFVVSSIVAAPDHGGPETLAFAADETGEVTSWLDVAGGRGWTRAETIAELAEVGPDPDSSGRGVFGDTKRKDARDPAEIFAGSLSSLAAIAGEVRRGL